MTGEDVEINVADIDTDVNFEVNLNDLARTEGIVRKDKLKLVFQFHWFLFRTLDCWQQSLMKNFLHLVLLQRMILLLRPPKKIYLEK